MKKILFLTTNSLSSNPRLVKEISFAHKHFECTVSSFRLFNWSDEIDNEIKAFFGNVKFLTISSGRKPFIQWMHSTIIEKLCRLVYPVFRNVILINAYGHSKRSSLLWRKIKGINEEFDLVVAHNLAAVYPAYMYFLKNGVPFAFDIEDYHPGEVVGADVPNEVERRRFIIRNLLPNAFYLSFASELIGKYTINDFSSVYKNKTFLISNSFAQSEFTSPAPLHNYPKLRLVWFSQYITTGRGLEELIEAIESLHNHVELHLIGSLKEQFKNSITCNMDNIFFYPPMKQIDLHQFLCNFDVGLALEMSKVDVNKDIAVSNKIYAYAQAGIYILATNTSGQTGFIEQHEWCGQLTGQTSFAIRNSIEKLIERKKVIRQDAQKRFQKGLKLSWENEIYKLKEVWK